MRIQEEGETINDTSGSDFVPVVKTKKKLTTKKKQTLSRELNEETSQDVGLSDSSQRPNRNYTTSASEGETTEASTVSKNRKIKKLKKKAKKEELKKVVPPKHFIREIEDSEDIDKVKEELWSEVVKRVKIPKIIQTKIRTRDENRRELQIITGDTETYAALRDISEEQRNLEKSITRKPTFRIFDV